MKKLDIVDMNRFTTIVTVSALRCAYCDVNHFQAFKDDIYFITDLGCAACGGRGIFPIPACEVGI